MNLKEQAARRALAMVQDGMRLGLGTGSTTSFFVELLGEQIRTGGLRHIAGVPTSRATEQQARSLGIPLVKLSDHPSLDLAVDGADEVDAQLNLIKGLGRALLREKMIAVHARRFVVIVDDSKLVERLGCRGPLPVEIVQFEAGATVRWLNSLGCRAELWLEEGGHPVVTDNGNYLARCWFEGEAGLQGIQDPYQLAQRLSDRPGVVEHGLFLDLASQVIVAGDQGMRVLERET